MRRLARTFIDRANQQGIIGCLRDNEALAYWTGAATTLCYTEHGDLAEDVAKIGVVEVAARGFQAILELAI